MSCNDNQNHLVRAGRTTSRVLAPSGGQSSLSFGVAPKKPTPKPPVPAAGTAAAPPVKVETPPFVPAELPNDESVVESSLETEQPQPTTTESTPTTTTSPEEPVAAAVVAEPSNSTPPVIAPFPQETEAVSGNAFVTGSNMNGGCVMTGRPSSRVLAPPGGHTSFKLG